VERPSNKNIYTAWPWHATAWPWHATAWSWHATT